MLIRWWSECASPIISFLISSELPVSISNSHLPRALQPRLQPISYQAIISTCPFLISLPAPCIPFLIVPNVIYSAFSYYLLHTFPSLYFCISLYFLVFSYYFLPTPLSPDILIVCISYFLLTSYSPHSPLIFWFFVFRLCLLLLTHPLPSPDNKCAAPAGATVSQPTTEFTRLGKIPPNAHNWGRNNMSQDHKEKVSAVLDNLGKGCYIGDLGGVWK